VNRIASYHRYVYRMRIGTKHISDCYSSSGPECITVLILVMPTTVCLYGIVTPYFRRFGNRLAYIYLVD